MLLLNLVEITFLDLFVHFCCHVQLTPFVLSIMPETKFDAIITNTGVLHDRTESVFRLDQS